MPKPNFCVTVEFYVSATDKHEAADQVADHQLVKGYKNWEIVSTEEE